MSQPFRTPILTGPLGPGAWWGRRLGGPQEGGEEYWCSQRAERTRYSICYHLWQPERTVHPLLPLPSIPPSSAPFSACLLGGGESV